MCATSVQVFAPSSMETIHSISQLETAKTAKFSISLKQTDCMQLGHSQCVILFIPFFSKGREKGSDAAVYKGDFFFKEW